jgi:hypothetical protein
MFIAADSCRKAASNFFKDLLPPEARRSSFIGPIAFAKDVGLKLMPMVIMDAFSVEIYLKCLQYLESGALVTGHNLLELFNGLPKSTKRELVKHYNEFSAKTVFFTRLQRQMPKEDLTLEGVLRASANVFTESRYS